MKKHPVLLVIVLIAAILAILNVLSGHWELYFAYFMGAVLGLTCFAYANALDNAHEMLAADPANGLWLIWSMEHKMWWGQNSLGYTIRREDAGRYTLAKAHELVANANYGAATDRPHEAMIKDEPVS